MEYVAGLMDPLGDVRDVVESFRCCGVIPAGWEHALAAAVTALEQLPAGPGYDGLRADLVPQLQLLLSEGLPGTPQAVDGVADRVAAELTGTRVPGIPLPGDDDWSFGPPTAS